jgi:2'-5' RNA ligase
MKTGIVLLAELAGPVADRIHEIQREFDPRMAAELPPHVTLSGSSGMGLIPNDTPVEALRQALEPIARDTAPITVRFHPPHKFLQSIVVVLPIDPYGPIRALHERIKLSGLSYEQPRFTFTPHLTLSFYPELTRDRLRELLRFRITEPLVIDSIQAYRAIDLTRTMKVFDLPLSGSAST